MVVYEDSITKTKVTLVNNHLIFIINDEIAKVEQIHDEDLVDDIVLEYIEQLNTRSSINQDYCSVEVL